MNQEYTLSGNNSGSMFSALKNISGTQKIIAAFVVALLVIVIVWYFFYRNKETVTKTETFMMPSTTMRQQIAHFPEAMTASEANASCGLGESAEEDAYSWAQSEISSPGEPMTGKKTDNALSRTLQGY